MHNYNRHYYLKIPVLITFFLLLFLTTRAQVDTIQKVVANRMNGIEHQDKPYVVLLSLDGFRWDLADKYNAKNLIRLRDEGINAEYMESSFPSLTFPNHYSIATGLFPSHHGLVDNIFYDRKRSVVYRRTDPKLTSDSSWYAGVPIWVLAEQQKMLSAVFYWIGSEVAVQGIRPTYSYDYSEIIPLDRRINQIKLWLELPKERRPHFIAAYFPQVDKAGHKFGPESKELIEAVKILDETVGKLAEIAKETGLPINFIVASDHGMTTVDRENTLDLPVPFKNDRFIVPPGNSIVQVYAKNRADIRPAYKATKKIAKDYNVYLRSNLPKSLHYRTNDDLYNRIGDLVLIPKLPKVFSINGVKPDIGQHGFDPKFKDMHATFYAWGPQLKTGVRIPAFKNVNIYPLIAEILNLSYDHKIDGDISVLREVLK